MSITRHLDEIDVLILAELQNDGRMTNAELAKRIRRSPPSTLQRVRALERSGFIRSYTALLDPERLGLRTIVLAMISLSLHQEQPIERFRKSVQDIDEIVECYNVSGEFDFLLKILVKDIRAYEVLMRERLSKIKGVRQIRSSFVLGSSKHTTRVPLPIRRDPSP
ncbi:MAG: Lrp/AsnC family transcriptional regulator [Fimbriimonas ginsengisoli]|uniref:Lrp/AsnC family transcriptional regulator n=1 Tax=Fimbriimonas ginsengisoli TaxID=1005039 RepID=A0A931PTQ5_FIMGI|nr:Lrp/AsnC family transcriptional regulator [Fimbriimonas ginsengisoli]